jgi:hypothetical protein
VLSTAMADMNYFVLVTCKTTSGATNRTGTWDITSTTTFTITIKRTQDSTNQDEDFGFAVFGDI